MADLNRNQKTIEKWRVIAELFGYHSEKELYLSELKTKDTVEIAKMVGYSPQTIKYRMQRVGVSIYVGKVFICRAGNCSRPCTPPNEHVCDQCMKSDFEPGFEAYG